MTWTPENWQQIGDIAIRLANEKARQRSSAPGLTANKEEMAMMHDNSTLSQPARHLIVSSAADLAGAVEYYDMIVKNFGVDRQFRIDGAVRVTLSDRFPTAGTPRPSDHMMTISCLLEGMESASDGLMTATAIARSDDVEDVLCVMEDMLFIAEERQE